MINLKTLCLSFLLSGLFINCSSAQDKPLQPPSSSIGIEGKRDIEGKRFESTEGGFTINILEAPLQTRYLGSEKTDKKGIDVGKFFAWKSGKIIYTAMYMNPFDDNGNSLSMNLEEMNSGVRKTIGRKQIKIISEKSISLGKYPGTEIRYIDSNGIKFVCRNYLVNSRGYQIITGYGDNDEKEALEVLDSFKLLTDKM